MPLPFDALNQSMQRMMMSRALMGGTPAVTDATSPGGIWGDIADFLSGQGRKRPYDKMNPGMPKDPNAQDDGNLASSLGVYRP